MAAATHAVLETTPRAKHLVFWFKRSTLRVSCPAFFDRTTRAAAISELGIALAYRRQHALEGAQVDSDPEGLNDHAALGVEDSAGEIAPFREGGRVGGTACLDHFLGGRDQVSTAEQKGATWRRKIGPLGVGGLSS